MKIRVDEVTHAHGWFGAPVFERFNLDIPPGRTVLLGPNGAGKSTLMSLLASAVLPRKGRIHIGEHRTDRRRDLAPLRRAVGWMPQTIATVTGLTVREQVAYHAWAKGENRADAWESALHALRAVNMADLADRSVRKLSGGQLRRVGLAQSIVHRPSVLLLDEPTAGLDPAQRNAFRRILAELDTGATVLVSTHQTGDLSDLFASVIVLADGRTGYHGPTADFLALAPQGDNPERRAEAAYSTLLEQR